MQQEPAPPAAAPARFGIRQKMLLVIGGVLAVTIALLASLASYYTNRQNEAAAFGDLDNNLLAWQGDLDASTTQIKKAALAITADEGVLEQLTELLAIEMEADALAGRDAEIERTLSYTRAVLLNRLYLMLRTGAFASIAVYTSGHLTQYLSAAEAGMSVRWNAGAAPVWIRTPLGPEEDRPFESWPSWREARPPAGVAFATPEVRQPKVLDSFPTMDTAAIDVAVPLQAVVQHFPRRLLGRPIGHLLSDLSVADDPDRSEANVPAEARPQQLAVLVFRKLLDRSVLTEIGTKTGKWPALLSLDGQHRQELTDFALFPAELPPSAAGAAAATEIVRSTVNTPHGSFYVVMSPWRFEGRPRLMLGFALSRDKTLQNVRQTVVAILIVAAIILLGSVAIGAYWVRRFTDPIVALTDAAHGIVGTSLKERDGVPLDKLQPIDIRAPDEIGDLAQAFNTMIAELRRSFVTLEQRVRTRTEEVRLQANYFRTLIDTIPLLVSLKDTSGRYLAANEPLARAYGLQSAEQMIGKTDADIRPDLAGKFGSADDLRAMSAKMRATEIVQIDLDSGSAWAERFRAPVMDEEGRVLGLVRVTRDITVQKAAEAARETALAEAMHLAKLRSQFLARLSHELRTPLNSILGYTQILQQDAQLTEPQAQKIAVIKSGGEHLLNLINDILDLARIDADRLELTPTELDLYELVRAVADIIRVKAGEKGLRFASEAVPLAGTVQVDAKRLRQVLLNLLSNAVKFTDSGTITLRMRQLAAAAPGGDSARTALIRFEVQDSGIGMSAAQLARLFQPFEQVADAERREGGAGLGLAISQQLVRLMGGRIRVDSEPGKGSVFSFELRLPLITSTRPPAAAPVIARQERTMMYEGRRRSILIVDDYPLNRALLTDMLTPVGFEIFEAGNGQEALDVLQQRKPDLIIMDTVMPVMDGLEATRRIRRDSALAQIPIFAVSANASHSDAISSYEAGVNVVLPKPINLKRLIQALGQQLDLKWVDAPSQKNTGAPPVT